MLTLTELCQTLHNWFVLEKQFGTITISDGAITIDRKDPGLLENQYFRIVGSVYNDGVHKNGDYSDTLEDETFDGALWLMGIPKAVLKLADEIDAWREKYEATDSAALSPFNSESFGGYSYSKGNNTTQSGNGSGGGWESVFASRLAMWRKI